VKLLPHYKNLRAEMARKGVTLGQIAKLLNVRFATVSDKLNGRSRFFCDEALRIKRHFFPDFSIDYLFDDDQEHTA
jgi:transcriptional regulator with XRE-family HTH domain